MKHEKPLGRKSYGSIGRLPSSRMGPSDSHVHEGVNGGAKRDHRGGVRRDHLAAAGLSP